MSLPVILSLCDESGNWSRPYQESGAYEVIRVSLNGTLALDGSGTIPCDVRTLPYQGRVHGILAAPPCTVFAVSGARWKRTPTQMLEGLSVVDACLRVIAVCRPKWWALENPVGTLRRWIGPAAFWFDPCDFGDPWTKKTGLWGDFNRPIKSRVEPTQTLRVRDFSPGPDRAALRSATPTGFARAFFEANP